MNRTEYLKQFNFSFEDLIEPKKEIDSEFEEAFMEVYNALCNFENKYIERDECLYM